MPKKVKAVIFDLDGTLVDSMWIWDKVDTEYFNMKGLTIPKNLKDEINHLSFEQTAYYFKNKFNISDSIEDILNTWYKMAYNHYSNDISLKNGALDFLKFLKSNNMKLQHVKPHGALYNMASKDYNMAKAICEGIYEFDKDIILLGLSGSELIKAAKDTNLKTANEVFADRAYNDDGSLVSRKKEGAVITDENLAIKRVVKMIKENKVTSINGKEIEIIPQSICVHGDNLKALEFVKKIRETLEKEGILIEPLSNIV